MTDREMQDWRAAWAPRHISDRRDSCAVSHGAGAAVDTAFSRTMGLDPRQMRYIGVKSTVHFRAGFESWAGAIYAVSEPSVHDPVGKELPFHNLGRKLYPLDDI